MGVACRCCGLIWSTGAFGQQAEEADEEEEEEAEEVEELIVTGSFIRRDNFDLPSADARDRRARYRTRRHTRYGRHHLRPNVPIWR